ncbi:MULTISPECIES: TMAO reductase system periplasmic protein TorT [unclassified Photobacterium]|uniref:TMAO reductase system periplasmic protein TorT n=1 Tax=unclassified Photobacterium TaxID=2628852 RepID=UPI001EDDA5CB|nr:MULTISPECIES: TMAO reductase system periplasmic protein TorT [unclassified Photobacterium]MCG3864443.1 TMAO reductase system periplasmic protein TorT [Photobacterium sp. Ph6]MCG3875973.1 TMAO reductase system periplasmic protein TorT [Photobacterium sp. Ph5]
MRIFYFVLFLFSIQTASAREVISYQPPFQADKKATKVQYEFVTSVTKPWKVCAVYPHLKDSYWLSINYGMVKQAKKLGITLKVMEAGGYPNLDKQTLQLENCRKWGADAIILGTVDSEAYNGKLSTLIGDTPVFLMTNNIDFTDPDIRQHVKAKVGVNWYDMGKAAGEFLAKRHPKGSGVVKVAWLPGPQLRGGTKPVSNGFKDAIKGSDVKIVTTLWGDNSKELQRNLIQHILATKEEINYIVGGAVAAEVAISELRTHDIHNIKIVSTYLSHGVYRGLRRNRILFAPTDKMAEQAMLSIDQAVRYLEHKPVVLDVAPSIVDLTPKYLPEKVIAESLSPAEFRPSFYVKDHQVKH